MATAPSGGPHNSRSGVENMGRKYLLLQAPVMSLYLLARQVFGHLGVSM